MCAVLLLVCVFVLGASTASPSAAPRYTPEDGITRARRLLDEGKLAQARALCFDALKRDPKDVRALRALAAVERESGNDDEATRLLERVVATDPKDASGWRQLAFAYRRAGRTMEALTAAETAMALSKEQDPALADLVAKLVSGAHGELAQMMPGAARPTMPGMPSIPDPMSRVPRPGAAPDARMLMNPK
jgi:Tfp pilus assembly protein PilF